MHRLKKISLVALTLGMLALPTAFAVADQLIVPIPGLKNSTDIGLGEYISAIYKWGIGVAALLAVLMIVFGGAEYILSAGSFVESSSGKERIKSAVFGLIILLGASVILRIVNVGLTDLTLDKLDSQEIITASIKEDALRYINNARANEPSDRALASADIRRLEDGLATKVVTQAEFDNALGTLARKTNEYYDNPDFFNKIKQEYSDYAKKAGETPPTDQQVFDAVKEYKRNAYGVLISKLKKRDYSVIQDQLRYMDSQTLGTRKE